jgi:acyl-[acyl-carrier-protein] desaturase
VSIFALPDALEARAEELLHRHLARSKEWFPHQLVPWSQGRDFLPGDVDGESATAPFGPGITSALFVNLLTEDNLPHYFHTIASAFTPESAMGQWSRRWAAEEQRHAIVIRDWLCVTRGMDLVALERARMRQVTAGFPPKGRSETLSDGLVYLALQELATRVSHWNTGQLLDAAGAAVMRRVAADENLHFLFYRDMATAALELDPSEAVLAIDRQVTEFEMPGTGIDGFAAHAAAIAVAGIYDFRIHYEQILVPVVLQHWRLESVTGLNAAAEAAREHVLRYIGRLKRVADRMAAQAADAAADAAAPVAVSPGTVGSTP